MYCYFLLSLKIFFLFFKISQRIEEIDNFYEENFGQPNILHFEKAIIRLKRLLTYTPDLYNLADNKNQIVPEA